MVVNGDPMVCYGNCSEIGTCRRNSVKLSSLNVGEEAVVVDIEAENDTRLRIMEMGLVKMTRLKITKKSPMGDPISIKIRGYELMLRNREAEDIVVNRIVE
ncbi:MAG: ferrous iron transport protein A [Rickettsiales bacterium]|jgi:Fe2+ transport system protein FeoA|nr:ferrous iron transport protein A [Rickettsiales bacterium]